MRRLQLMQQIRLWIRLYLELAMSAVPRFHPNLGRNILHGHWVRKDTFKVNLRLN